MARPASKPSGTDYFDVMCSIGRVVLGDTGPLHPSVAAFQLIGEYEQEGTFTFPAPEGGVIRVTVEHGSDADLIRAALHQAETI